MSLPILSRALAACMLLLLGAQAQAQAPAWPAQPVRLVVGFPPGGIVDTVARQLQPRRQAALGQTVIVDNRSGAGGTLAAAEVARAVPDGHTLLMVFDSYATYPLVYPKLVKFIAANDQPQSRAGARESLAAEDRIKPGQKVATAAAKKSPAAKKAKAVVAAPAKKPAAAAKKPRASTAR